jgi:catechol 2,3-dioxygenase-like lactoylglutathione lyase family enzyme
MKNKFKSLVWLGVRTKKFRESCHFYEKTLGLRAIHKESGFREYDLPNGDRIELFSTSKKSQKHFTTGPVAGFLVDDIVDARKEMEQSGIKFIGPIRSGSTSNWAHFRGPDGNVYEITNKKK